MSVDVFQREPLVTQSLQAAVYARLREMLRDGELRRLTQDRGLRLKDLADLLGVSTMPVREAVRRLQAEGIVTSSRNDGIRVVRLSRVAFAEIADMRVRLETLALERAIDRFKAVDLERAREHLMRMDRPMASGSWREANASFHAAIYAPGDYRRVVAAIENLWVVIEPYLRIYTSTKENLRGSQREHHAIYDAVRRRERKEALQLVAKHIRRSEDLLLTDRDSGELIVD